MQYKLKRITENELETLMNWRMREDISDMMFTDVKLTMETQRKWYEKVKADPTQIRWIIFADDVPIGSMYLTDIDRNNKRCESGWLVAEKEYRSLKLAMALQQNMLDFAFDVLGLNRVYGQIIDDNPGVLRLVKLCGLDQEGTLRQHVCKNGKFHDVFCVGITKDAWHEKRETYHYEKIAIEP